MPVPVALPFPGEVKDTVTPCHLQVCGSSGICMLKVCIPNPPRQMLWESPSSQAGPSAYSPSCSEELGDAVSPRQGCAPNTGCACPQTADPQPQCTQASPLCQQGWPGTDCGALAWAPLTPLGGKAATWLVPRSHQLHASGSQTSLQLAGKQLRFASLGHIALMLRAPSQRKAQCHLFPVYWMGIAESLGLATAPQHTGGTSERPSSAVPSTV